MRLNQLSQDALTAHPWVNLETLEAGVYVDQKQLAALKKEASSLHFPANRQVKHLLAGFERSHMRGRGMEFAEVRVYQPGDDIRNIDWRVTARRNQAHTKIFQEDKNRPVFLLVDQSSSLFFGSQTCFKSVLATKLAALLGWLTLDRKDKVGGIVFNEVAHFHQRPKTSQKHFMAFLNRLVAFNHALGNVHQQKKQTYFTDQLQQCARIIKPGSLVFLISDFIDFTAECIKPLSLISRHNDIVAWQVQDPFEAQFQGKGWLQVTDGSRILQFNASAHRAHHYYQKSYRERLAQISLQLKSLGIMHAQLSTHDQLLDQVRQHLIKMTHQKKSTFTQLQENH